MYPQLIPDGGTSSRTYDLHSVANWGAKRRRWARNIWGGMGLLIIAVVAYWNVEGALGVYLLGRVLVIDLLGASFVALIFTGYNLQGPVATSSTIDGSSLSFTAPNGRKTVLDWGDSRFRLKIREWDSSHRAGGDYPFIHEKMGGLGPSTPLTPEFFSGIMTEVRKRNLLVEVRKFPGPFRSGFTEYTIRAPRPA